MERTGKTGRQSRETHEAAIYLRKSREDSDGEEDVLLKHETTLTDLARQNTWRYVIYPEVGSSDSIEFRPDGLDNGPVCG